MNYRRLYNRLMTHYGRLLAKTSASGWAPFPPVVSCIITYECNLACPFCFVEHDWNKQSVATLTVGQWRRIFDQIPSRSTINLTGGEVFCHPQFFDLLREATASHRVTLVTNGTTLDENTVHELVACGAKRTGGKGLLQIGVSVNEPLRDADEVHRIVARKNEVLARLDQERKRRQKRGLHIDLKVLIREETAAHLPLFVEAVNDSYPDTLTFQMMFLFNLACFMNIDPTDTARIEELRDYRKQAPRKLSFAKQNELAASLQAIKTLPPAMQNRIGFLPALSTDAYLRHYADIDRTGDYHCYNPWTHLMIDPHGVAFQCLNPQGIDLQKVSLPTAWNSPGFREFRRRMTGNRPFPICAGCCFLSE
ncbi:MAG TPA: radical SAM protein [bacterium]|nr:radical SAM protein [bacterium]